MIPNPLESIYAPWEEPSRHRVKNEAGGPAIIKPGRRPSRALLVPYVRDQVSLWRDAGYPGATETTKTLLRWWFDTAHPRPEGEFRYHFAQREAVETVIWLYEIAQYRALSDMFASLIPEDEPEYGFLVNSVPESEDAWGRYCSKIATGGGKTKCMSLVIAWSYFNSLYEAPEEFPRHFVVIAPNLIVFDRLRTDFEGGKVFYDDPVLPPDFADEFSLETVLQDEAGGASYTGSLYLTNIHRLFEREGSAEDEDESPAWAGPDVKRGQVFKTGEKLRNRITEHPSIMVLNDEAHHLHDPESAWNEAIQALHDQSRTKGNRGVALQVDYTATPKHNNGTLFRHIVSDFPLGEAVDAGIVKVPVIGQSDEIHKNEAAGDAFGEYRTHITLGYQQYKQAFDEWQGTRKPILFIMTESAQKANEIASALNALDQWPGDDEPNLLKGRVLNLHTRLKGKIKTRKIGNQTFQEFVYSESASGISDDDLKEIRKWSQQLDAEDSPYRCVVSVLMLREGWDVRNVTTIVPLRPYNAKSNILAEQTLGRGLRRMTPPGETLERVTVVEHPAFTKFYQEELQQEGLDVIIEPIEKVKPQSVTIFVDFKNKDVEELEIELPLVSDSIEATATLDDLQFEDIERHFKESFQPLRIKEKRDGVITFVEKTLFTDEVVNSIEIDRGLLRMGATAVSVYVRELEKACRLQSSHALLAPLLQRFIEEVLFERPVSLYSGEIDHRMGDVDVAEHIRATFAPLIRAKTVTTQSRKRLDKGGGLSTWRNFQATRSDRKPCVPASKTMFNLAPCDSPFEAEFVEFLDDCSDVKSFARNAGPQKLILDYLAMNGRASLYWPDFFIRGEEGTHYLVELKGAEDTTVALKARAAVEWCKAASTSGRKWKYLYVSQVLFEQVSELSIESLASACEPKLRSLLKSLETKQMELPLEAAPEELRKDRADKFTEGQEVGALPESVRHFVEQAVNQLEYDKRMGNRRLNAAFTVLLEPFEALCGQLLKQEMDSYIPATSDERRYYFDPYIDSLPNRAKTELKKHQRNLQRNLVHNAHSNRIGNLLFCLSFAVDSEFQGLNAGGVWDDVAEAFSDPGLQGIRPHLVAMNEFRNKRVVHVEEPITEVETAETNLRHWIEGLILLTKQLIP